jgi:hypothetical protein
MMLNNSCNHISGDDTNDNGYRLIIKEDDECECNVVRNLTSDDNIGIGVNSQTNSLYIYDRKDANRLLITGGVLNIVSGLLTFFFNFSGVRFRPIGSRETINVNMVTANLELNDLIRLYQRRDNGEEFALPIDQRENGGYQFNPNWAVYLTADPTLMGRGNTNNNIIFAVDRNIGIINRSNKTVLLCYRDDTDMNNRFLTWVPTNTKIPYRLPITQTITYNANTPIPEVEIINYSSLQTISGGGTVTFRNTNSFLWVSWDRSIVISHIPTNTAKNTIVSVNMPSMNSNITCISSNGTNNVVVRYLGIEMGFTNRALFYNTTTNQLVLVDNNTPRRLFNMGSEFILICFVSLDRSLSWLPGRINLPCILNVASTYNNDTGSSILVINDLQQVCIHRLKMHCLLTISIEDITKGKKVNS